MGTAEMFRGGTGADDGTEARVWILPVPPADSTTALDLTVLDEEEHRRVAAFVRDADRVLYAFAHLALRTVLSAVTGAAPGELRFARDPCPCCDKPHGRPVLTTGSPEFSLSHTRGLVVIGTASTPIGVDVETVPAPEAAEQLVKVLHPAERAELEATRPEDRPAAFARLWSRKEAYLKGLGTGLGRDPAADDVRHEVEGWHLVDLSVGPDHAAAVAIASPTPCGVGVHHGLPHPARG
ncbi:4'-phosphopantetheinyl transferase family protein [Streptomyces sp. NPDC058872]|uniref:4'-phosphopantetheinyl transferase family protein n=1 Tax=Streptomyces sp. NPDC058872 TaxID=3346661 RepID=UPI0036D13744